MRRSEQRDWVFKLVYENSINKIENLDLVLENHGLAGEDFIKDSLKSLEDHYDEIESKLSDQLNKRYQRLSRVSKAILFLSINEIYFMDIPHQVSINEAVDLAKTYGNESDYQMINSILGKIVRKDG